MRIVEHAIASPVVLVEIAVGATIVFFASELGRAVIQLKVLKFDFVSSCAGDILCRPIRGLSTGKQGIECLPSDFSILRELRLADFVFLDVFFEFHVKHYTPFKSLVKNTLQNNCIKDLTNGYKKSRMFARG